MGKSYIFLFICLSLFAFSCKDETDELNLDPETEALVNLLQEELQSLDIDPLTWKDQHLRWLDPLAGKSVIALGESTHGTAEFFKAKHRIFKYLVENHGYRIFAIEADFGESLFIDEAIQNGNLAELEQLMKTKMHFWTWKTEEVKELLEWMCTYNQGKAKEEKLHYMGVDCQFNTYHPDLLLDYLESKGVSFLSYAYRTLNEAESASGNRFPGYISASFDEYLGKLDALKDSISVHKEMLIAGSSEKEYLLHERILEVIRQVSEVIFYQKMKQYAINYRDKYMAENTKWLLDYFENDKLMLWAHNGHIANWEYGSTGSMGNYLSYALGDQYVPIGFLFSQGTFTAYGTNGEGIAALLPQTLDTIPKENSLNAIMSYTGVPAFSIELAAIRNYVLWYKAFDAGLEYFQIGSVYTNEPADYYSLFDPDFFQYIIYFDKSTASVLL